MYRWLEKSALWIGGVGGLLALVVVGLLLVNKGKGEKHTTEGEAEKHTAVRNEDDSNKRDQPHVVESPVIREMRQFDRHSGAILSVAFSVDGRSVLSVDPKAVHGWNVKTGMELYRTTLLSARKAALSPDGKQVLNSWRYAPKPEDKPPPSHLDEEGCYLFEYQLEIRDVRSEKVVFGCYCPQMEVKCVAFSPNGSYFLEACDVKHLEGNELIYQNSFVGITKAAISSGGGISAESGQLIPIEGVVDVAAISGSGTEVLVAGDFGDDRFAFHLLKPGPKKLYRNMVNAYVTMILQNQPLAAASSSSHFLMFDKKIIRSFQGHTGIMRTLMFLPDGRKILSAGEDKTIRLWDTTTGKQLKCFSGHKDTVNGLAVSASGRRLLSVSSDRTVRLWNLQSGDEIACFTAHKEKVRSVALSPDGRYALSGDEGGIVRLLELPPEDTKDIGQK